MLCFHNTISIFSPDLSSTAVHTENIFWPGLLYRKPVDISSVKWPIWKKNLYHATIHCCSVLPPGKRAMLYMKITPNKKLVLRNLYRSGLKRWVITWTLRHITNISWCGDHFTKNKTSGLMTRPTRESRSALSDQVKHYINLLGRGFRSFTRRSMTVTWNAIFIYFLSLPVKTISD